MQRREQVAAGPAPGSHEAPTAAEKKARRQYMKEDVMQLRWKAVKQQAPGQASQQGSSASPTSQRPMPEEAEVTAAVQLPVWRPRKKPSGKASSSSSSSLPQQPQPPRQAEPTPPVGSTQSQSDWDGLWEQMQRELFEPIEQAPSTSSVEALPELRGNATSATCADFEEVEHVFSSQELEAELTVQLTLGGFG